ncbi:MAG: hypothetical protein K9H49_14345 [Bacteroidales bacterium]|nr:hypothetical protein [Bacteroidales bacterium]MCF8405614.1 hypothetical protein [Bacteroidales bacterium]
MKFFGFFNNKINAYKIPKGFINYHGLYADESPEMTCIEDYRLFLWGKVYQLLGKEKYIGISNQDIRTILETYMEIGSEAFNILDGDFICLIIFKDEIKIFRDFKGTGPQVFYTNDIYSNSFRIITSLTKESLDPDMQQLSLFLKYGFLSPGKSGIEGIKRLEAGHMLTYGHNTVRTESYIEPGIIYSKSVMSMSEEELSNIYSGLHAESIRHRVAGKRKVGLLLSGGYDSGGNLASLRSFYNGNVNSYTISFKDNPHSELEYVKILSQEFNATLKHYEINGSELSFLPEIIDHVGTPFQESGLMINYLVMKMAAKDKMDVILGGDGNDQLFGTASKEIALKTFANTTGMFVIQALFKATLGNKESSTLLKKLNFYNDKIHKITYPDHWGFNNNHLNHKLNDKDLFQLNIGFSTSFKELYEMRRKNVDIPVTAINVILYKASKMAEMFNVPLTYPYFSKSVFDFVNSLPTSLKIKGGFTHQLKGRGISKYLHKKTYMDKLPESITQRKKQGGFVPLSLFFLDEHRNDDLFNFIKSSPLLKSLLKNSDSTIDSLKTAMRDKSTWFWYQQVYYSRLFNLLAIAIWEKLFLERNPADAINLYSNENKIS